jgi:hypothetical protein
MRSCCELDLKQRNLIKEKEQSLLYDQLRKKYHLFLDTISNIFEVKHKDEVNEKILAIDHVFFEDNIDDVDPTDKYSLSLSKSVRMVCHLHRLLTIQIELCQTVAQL